MRIRQGDLLQVLRCKPAEQPTLRKPLEEAPQTANALGTFLAAEHVRDRAP